MLIRCTDVSVFLLQRPNLSPLISQWQSWFCRPRYLDRTIQDQPFITIESFKQINYNSRCSTFRLCVSTVLEFWLSIVVKTWFTFVSFVLEGDSARITAGQFLMHGIISLSMKALWCFEIIHRMRSLLLCIIFVRSNWGRVKSEGPCNGALRLRFSITIN